MAHITIGRTSIYLNYDKKNNSDNLFNNICGLFNREREL